MKHILIIISLGLMIMISACQGEGTAKTDIPPGFHKVLVKEVIHTTKYTYLFVSEGDKEDWLAIPKMDAKVGATYYYEGGFDMVDFKSKELDRTFDKVIFLGGVSTEPVSIKKESPMGMGMGGNAHGDNPHGDNPHGDSKDMSMPTDDTQMAKPSGKITTEKTSVDTDVAEGGITIAELFANKEKYKGKTVKIKGKVVKFSEAIMNTNWIHLQDGTDHEGSFDLTITSPQTVKVGSVVTLEGEIILDKDFGYGYFYDVLMQNAKVVE